MKRFAQFGLAVVFAGAVGCTTGDRGSKVVSQAAVPNSGLALEATASEGSAVHGLEMHQEAEGLWVSGHVGPATRYSNSRPGHIDVRVIAPDGREAARASGRLKPISASPKTFVERRFRVMVPAAVPAGSEVRVVYHGSEPLCYASSGVKE
jgi:hypothetical protein